MVVQMIFGLVVVYLTYKGIKAIHAHVQSQAADRADGDVIRFLKGHYLDCSKSKVTWNWTEPIEVGSTVSFTVKFFCYNLQPYSIRKEDNIRTKIQVANRENQNVAVVEEYLTDDEVQYLKVSFTVRVSTVYNISIKSNDEHLHGSPFKKSFQPGPLSPDHTRLVRAGHVATTSLTVTQAQAHVIKIDANDEYNNDCSLNLTKNDFDQMFTFHLYKVSDPDRAVAYVWEISHGINSNLEFELTVFESGCFKALLAYNERQIRHGSFTVISLTEEETAEMKSNLVKKSLYYECRLIKDDGSSSTSSNVEISSPASSGTNTATPKSRRQRNSTSASAKSPRKVFCYITPRQLIIKEYLMLFFPMRVASFRISPKTEINFDDDGSDNGTLMTIKDGAQPKLTLYCSKRNVLIATFHSILYDSVGRSNSFEEKVQFFYKELRKHHQYSRSVGSNIYLKIERSDLLNTSLQCLKSLSSSDWHKTFKITFKGEAGVDWGGLNREWTTLLCKDLFSSSDTSISSSGLFRRFKDDPQALTLPAPVARSGFKLKHFELAGKFVGKCLLESALGETGKRMVAARFARSFLAQLIGMPVTYAHFESDDPDLYTSKINYILNCADVADLDLTFTEEVYESESGGGEPKTVELMTNGNKLKVTNENKEIYLNHIAKYRLCTSIKPEIDNFVKGLTSLVPDHLLSIFDENELELVMCGASQISTDDMRKHCNITGRNGYNFPKVMEWFWSVVSSLTSDELARLLQFITGCSQLPPGGFKSLEPRLTISSLSYNSGMLPTAHTCFNQLCLPEYESYEQLHRMLKIAITEGVCGFGQA